ncbi:hypothetical protein D3C85_1476210 [compost metagenome]
MHAGGAEPGIFGLHVFDAEKGAGNAVLLDRALERLCRAVGIGLQQQLDAIGIAGRGQRQPAMFAHGDVVLEFKTEHIPVEGKRLGLIIDEHAGDYDFHGGSS